MNQNQFGLSTLQGVLDLSSRGSSLSCQIDSSSAGGLVAGHPVKMVNSAGGIPKVVECAADEDDCFGFINYDSKKATHAVGEKVEVSFSRGAVMYMTASAAIARNGKVMTVPASQKVATATSTNMIIGRALDKAAADGDLIRVLIDLPGVLA